jgi:hypothetical protein
MKPHLIYCFDAQNASAAHMEMRALSNAAYTARTKMFVITKLEYVQMVVRMVIPEKLVITVSISKIHLYIV